jgi:N-methylhydantoinase A/oxoprolinase/acetone carboxylase beta subunit
MLLVLPPFEASPSPSTIANFGREYRRGQETRAERAASSESSLAAAQKASRPVFFSEHNGINICSVYDRNRLPPGGVIGGPAVIEEFDATTVIHPGYQAIVDVFGNLLIKEAKS